VSSSSEPGVKVHIKTLNSDRAQYGVGMPVIVFFSHTIKSGTALQGATKVTANGKPLTGAWYFETSSYYRGYPIEAHWRPKDYWPPHSQIHVDIPVKGLSGGGDLVFDDSLTLGFAIGASHILTVDDSTHRLTVVSDGKTWATFPVSLGATKTPTRSGIKVIMERLPTVCMHDIAGSYYECGIKLDQRLTYDGEYLHSAPWNCVGYAGCAGPANDIGSADSSNGCTNLRPADAHKLYSFLEVGDVVVYPNANGPRMQIGDGYGDWNLPWSVWQAGGLVPSS
jgi:lipoprotein-anchoring transpeptidase ErfK/SrfK